jgi:DNA mismatch endonuclease (patch repair protein)
MRICCTNLPDDFFGLLFDNMDKVSPLVRSQMMSRIRGRENKETELALAKLFRSYRISGWRRNHAIFGKPDFIFPKFRVVVFVDGCFWHGCPTHGTKPKSNRSYWLNKLSSNIKRDRLVTRTLRKSGWRVIRIWQHELSIKGRARLLHRLRQELR